MIFLGTESSRAKEGRRRKRKESAPGLERKRKGKDLLSLV